MSSIPPEEQPRVKTFDPLVLDRSVIALPLLREMEADLVRVKFIKDNYPDEILKYNAAIEYEQVLPGDMDVAAAEAQVGKMLKAAADAAVSASAKRLAVSDDPQQSARHEKLLAATQKPQVGRPFDFGGVHYQFADLHASVIRRFLAANDRLAERVVVHIYPSRFEIIIDLNLEHPRGREVARQWVLDNIDNAKNLEGTRDAGQEVHIEKDQPSSQYIFARLEARAIQRLVMLDMASAKLSAHMTWAVKLREKADAQIAAADRTPEYLKWRNKLVELGRQQVAAQADEAAYAALTAEILAAASALPAQLSAPPLEPPVDAFRHRAIYHIWPDFEVSAAINRSIATVKANAAQNSFAASGAGITWAVMDSGINSDHKHFAKHSNIDKDSTLHRDFTVDGSGPFNDENGHGTHVAGIIAGEWHAEPGETRPIAISRYLKTETGDVEYQSTPLDQICGMAPKCKLVSLRVLDEDGKGSVSNLIAAINHIQEKNGYGRRLIIHGVNMSLGYNFEPEWFACGQSPLCVEVDRLVKSGVVVVVAAGNTGHGTLKSDIGATSAGMALTINDPGNADLAITVGSTHRDAPHVYGVSYFSSKGPTGDGRLKPDLVAPGEKIISCAAGTLKQDGAKGRPCDYVETSGTSMAAPHVSGVIAGFLSVRTEFIGQAERVKDIFVSSATDLRRDRYFQGAGLVDLMRAIQSV